MHTPLLGTETWTVTKNSLAACTRAQRLRQSLHSISTYNTAPKDALNYRKVI